jgi:hypothetical protein
MWRRLLIGGALALAGCAAIGQVLVGSSAAIEVGGRVSESVRRSDCGSGAPMSTMKLSPQTLRGRWGAPAPLVPGGTATNSLALSATPTGRVLAGWVQGPPPKVFFGAAVHARASGDRATPRQARAATQKVSIAEGSFAGGFRRKAVLSVGRSGTLSNLYVAESTPDVGYVVWQGPSTALRLGVVCDRKIVVLNRRLVRDAVPLALFPLSGGRAAVVFDKYGHGTPFLEYGLLSERGRMGKIARIAHPGPRDTAATELSVNARGELVAAWVHNDGASPQGISPTSPRFVPAQLVVASCRPALHCRSPETIPLGTAHPACINPAVAISPDGTVTVIAAADDWGTGCDKPLGVRASVTTAGSANLRPMHKIQTEGDWPIAEPVGEAGTVWVFNSGLASSGSFSSSFLPATGIAHSRTSLLDKGGFWNYGQQLLSPANNGWYVITWSHANRRTNPNLSLKAVVGHDGHLEHSLVAVSATHQISAYLGAADGRGDAMILYSGSTDRGDGAPWPYTSGLYTTILRH